MKGRYRETITHKLTAVEYAGGVPGIVMVEDVGFTAVSHNINDFWIAFIAIFSFMALFCGASITSRRFAIADESIESKLQYL